MSLCSGFLGCNTNHTVLYSRDDDLSYHECRDCGIIWRDEKSFHLEKAYDQQYFDSKKYQKNRQHKIEKSGWLLDMARNFRPGLSSMLEIGCSLGNTLEAAQAREIDHLGIDISAYAIDYCRSKGLNASSKSLDQLIVEGHGYQVIFMQHVLEHFENPFQVLHQCHRLLDEQGLLIILIPNSQYRRSQKLRERHKFYSKRGVGLEHFVYFNYHNLERVLNSTGFEMVQRNYPLGVLKHDHLKFYFNRLVRRMLSMFRLDQELVVIAQKN